LKEMTRIAVVLAVAVSLAALAARGDVHEGDVAVPGVRSANYEFAYQRLHDAGLRVRIERPLTIASLCAPLVGSQTPVAGTKVPEGSLVVLEDAMCFFGLPVHRDVSAVVPDFTGEAPSRAAKWARSNGLFFEMRLAALDAGDAPSFFDNFQVERQEPAPGAILTPGLSRGNSFKQTPLVVFAKSD
jgi:hypothetical protein